MEKIVFAMFAAPGRPAQEALLNCRSIRSFCGEFSEAPLAVFYPQSRPFSQADREHFSCLNVETIPIPVGDKILRFPFGGKSFAAGVAETHFIGMAEMLAWVDCDALFFRQPDALLLPPGKTLGYRSVDHTNVGSPFHQAPDAFWETVYALCQVPHEALFPMTTTVDRQQVRPYINAGFLVVRPQAGLLRKWSAEFEGCFQDPRLMLFYTADFRYQIFIHQALLSAVILRELPQAAWHELPHNVFYPLHMHARYPAERRAAALNYLVSCRTDDLFDRPDWSDGIRILPPLDAWLQEYTRPLLQIIRGT